VTLNLNSPDFTTAQRVTQAINTALGANGMAQSLDATSIRVNAPPDPNQRVAFVAMLENLTLEPGEAAARVIVNSRTGTVVIGRNVKVLPAAVSHGSLTVTITERAQISQPGPFSAGTTQVVPKTDIEVKEEGRRMFVFDPGVSLDEIVRAVNNVGAAPGDLVAILEALRNAGALRAELLVI
jgi:flagellar P-ring protein precursor FlgI